MVTNLYFFLCGRTVLTHEPSDRHSYAAYWMRDLDKRPLHNKITNLTGFLERHDIPAFKNDSSFFVLNHQFIMQGQYKI